MFCAGTGKAGKEGELHARDGSKYVGEVAAGLPHGEGKNLVPKVRRTVHQLALVCIPYHFCAVCRFCVSADGFKSAGEVAAGLPHLVPKAR